MRLFEIVHVKEEAPDCFSYMLEPADGSALQCLPGQFLTFTMEINNRPQRRAYSISALYHGGKQFQVTVKKVDNGMVSRYIIAHWHTGSRVRALEAAGRFVLPDTLSAGDQFVFIVAGSGITPVFALLRALFESGQSVSVLLLTQFRREKEIIFHEALKNYKKNKDGSFDWVSFLSRPEDPKMTPQRLNNEKLESLLFSKLPARYLSALYYICGPLSFMRMAAFTLRETGVPQENIRRELFDPPREPATWFKLDAEPHGITVKTGGDEIRFNAAFPETIMDAANKAGVAIPYSCRAGICSTCVLRCVSGSVKMRINEVLTDSDLRAGLILTCVGYATSDLVLVNS